ncbi:MAG: beta-galactosidase trimerization domain-containing protein, partial [Ruminiclostridium sp.]
RIGEVYKSVEEKEKWCTFTKKVSQIGVYTADRAMEVEDHNEQGASNEGVYRMLTELHYLYDFIDFDNDIESYELVILPDKVRIPENIALKLKKYLKNGGKLLLTGSSGLGDSGNYFALEEFGIKYISEAEFNPRYVRITEDNFPDILPMDYVMYEKGISVNVIGKPEVAAYVVNPYFNRTYDRFCSHRQTPPAEVTDEPFIVENGNTIYISNPLFKDYAINGNKVYKDIIKHCIDKLIDKPILVTDLPSTAELTLRKQDQRYVLHALHYIPQRKCRTMDIIEEIIPVYDSQVKVYLNKTPNRVFLAPSLQTIDFKVDNGYVCFKLHELHGHQMVIIE